MKKATIIAGIVVVLLVFLTVVFQNRRITLTVTTHPFVKTEELLLAGFPYPIVPIYSAKDDFLTEVPKKTFEKVSTGDPIAVFEKIQEDFNYQKAQADYARSLLQDGLAVQKEKEVAMQLALNELKNTTTLSPINGYIIRSFAIENTFVNKGTLLFELIPEDFGFLIPVEKGLQERLKSMDAITLTFPRLGLSVSLTEMNYIYRDNQWCLSVPGSRFKGHIPLKEETCTLYVYYPANDLAWIPARFLDSGKVQREDGTWIPVEVFPVPDEESATNDGLVLVKGLTDGMKITGKR
ncbi:MAG TPA: hypothetical protein PLN20_01080 [Thermotogota bacterium]|nr:hypothetical protein [Thermotogota bacterium]OQC30687.1 MAG: hypothetical protein BWX67_01635 [Thermotogota bacterium ADurb.Bin062]HNW45867.1 hypothetical protein [Thermotogota bacterium]HNY81817.1 hypothetical protein [Thermotogota bacterium]HOD90335.1 hypothetical protein [Thermotogota bacterium]